ncbi:Sulfite exporter TauE/SafE [Seminavis robusta]|uniref:Sulfite exporter TauE/SafE n=1 Tax=Seminavis robusta TaxID=568900 RepID=A0A9N8HSN2_9STRA|nr:Sulfite exporter TauE/SafE [Seminavis robusta]|eukprot:Sro1466_g275040.1 Sulfite exporter TauE/SafE (345) ;mRNA; f:11063-12097
MISTASRTALAWAPRRKALSQAIHRSTLTRRTTSSSTSRTTATTKKNNPVKNNNESSVHKNPDHASTSSIDTNLLPKSFAIGSLAGLMGSLAGMGGGFVMIPLMTSRQLLGLTQHQAHGTSLFAVAATGVAGALGYQGQVQYDAAAAIAACGIVTAGLGASVTTYLSARHLKKALGVFMILVAPLVPLKGYLTSNDNNDNPLLPTEEANDKNLMPQQDKATNNSSWPQRLLPPAMIGLGSGFLAGLFGVGGGAVVVPALTLFTDVNHYQALGTSLCAMALPAISGTLTHFKKGNVAMRVAPALAAGAFCGGYLGGRIGLQIHENALRWGFSGLMVTLGVRTLIR